MILTQRRFFRYVGLTMVFVILFSMLLTTNIILVQASAPLLMEGFENGLNATLFPVMSGKTTATVSSDKAHNGTSSLKISNYYANAHTYTIATQGTYTVTAYVYDDASVVSPYFFIDVEGMNTSNVAYKTYLGLYSNTGNKAYWKYRTGSSWVDTTKARTTGWNKLRISFTSDKNIILSINDEVVYTSVGTANAGIYNTFTTMNFGNQLAQGVGATNGTFTYIDDITIEDTDSVSETLLNPPSVADFSVTQNELTMTANYKPFVGDVSTFQWSVLNTTNGNFEDIAGATSKIFTINQSYMNKTLKFTMVPKTVFGAKQADISMDITESFYQNVPVPSAKGVVVTQNNAELNGAYTFATTPASDSEDLSTYRWLVSDSQGGTYSEISGANGKKLTVTKEYQDKWFKFEVTPKTKYLSSTSILSDAKQEDYLKQIYPTVVSATTPSIIKFGQTSIAIVDCVKGALGADLDATKYVYSWYASDTSDGNFNLVEIKVGINTFTPTAEYAGAYFKFSVQPSDINGLLGVTVSSTNVVRESSSAVEAVNNVGGNTSTLAKVIKRYISELGLVSLYNSLSTQQMDLVNQEVASRKYTTTSDLVQYILEAIYVNTFKYVLKDFQSGYSGFMDDMGYWGNQPLVTDNTPGFIAGNKVMKLVAKKSTITFLGGGEGNLKDVVAAINLIPNAVIKFRYFIPTDQTIISNKFTINGALINQNLPIEKGAWHTVTCEAIQSGKVVTNLSFSMVALVNAYMYIDDLTVETDVKPSVSALKIGNVKNLYVCNFDDSTDVNFKGSWTEAVTTITDRVTTVNNTTPLTLPTSLTNVGLNIVDDTTAVGNKLLKLSWNNPVDTSSLLTTSQYEFYTSSMNRMSNFSLKMDVYIPSGLTAKALMVYLERPDGTIASSYPIILDSSYISGWRTVAIKVDANTFINKLRVKLSDVKNAGYIYIDNINIVSDSDINMIANYDFNNSGLDSIATDFSKYQWYQSTALDGEYTIIEGATSINLKVPRTSTMYYKCRVTPTANCGREGYTVFSEAFSVKDLVATSPSVNSIKIDENNIEISNALTATVEYDAQHSSFDMTKSVFEWYRADTADGDYKVFYVSSFGENTYTPSYDCYGAYIKVGVRPISSDSGVGEVVVSTTAIKEKTPAYLAINSLVEKDRKDVIETILPRYVCDLGIDEQYKSFPNELKAVVCSAVGKIRYNSNSELTAVILEAIDYYRQSITMLYDFQSGDSIFYNYSYGVTQQAITDPTIDTVTGNKVLKLFSSGGYHDTYGDISSSRNSTVITKINALPNAIVKFRYFIPLNQDIKSIDLYLDGPDTTESATIVKGSWQTMVCCPVADGVTVTSLSFVMAGTYGAYMYIDDVAVESVSKAFDVKALSLKQSHVTTDTETLTFAVPIGATNVSIQSSLNGVDWQNAVTSYALNSQSNKAVVIGLQPDTQYCFRLVVTGGEREGISNVINVLTDDVGSPESDFSFDESTGQITTYMGKDMEVIIPRRINGVTVKSIGNFAFYSCRNLKNITITDGITGIGVGAFQNCSSLESIIIPDSVTSLEMGAFDNCTSLKSVKLSDGLNSLSPSLFYGCTELTSITIPANVSRFNNVFYNCKNLKNIYTSNSNSSFCSIDGVLYSYDKTTIISYPMGRNGAYTISNGVKIISSNAFKNCSGLERVELPDGLIYIGLYAFQGCSKLNSIDIPASVTSIWDYAFDFCINLKSANFEGNAPSTFSYYHVFDNVSDGFKINYKPNASGFATPLWKGYDCFPMSGFAINVQLNSLVKTGNVISGSVSVGIFNSSTETKTANAVLAIYSVENKLIKLVNRSVNLAIGDNAVVFDGINISALDSGYTFKVFALDSMSSLQPLAEAVVGSVE